MSIATQIPSKLPGKFDDLVELMVPHAIVDDADYEEVSALVDKLAVLNRRTKGQEQYLETLSQLIEAYDRLHHPIDVSHISGLELLRDLVQEHKMSPSDLGRLLGNRTLGHKILNGDRELSKANMKALGERFNLNPGAFL